MWKTRIAEIAGYVIVLSGLLVMVGWAFDMGWLKSLSPYWVSMKFLTAVSFVLSGIELVLIVKSSVNGNYSGFVSIILPIFSLIIMLIMATILFLVIIGFDFGVVNTFVIEKPTQTEMVYSLSPGLPSIVTVVGFILIALAGLLETISYPYKKIYLSLLSIFVMTIGAVALINCTVNIPILSRYISGKSFAITISTASLFVIWGLGMLLCHGGRNEQNSK